MSVAQMCDELNERYKQKGAKMPAERHFQQLMDKVKTKEEAELAATAIGRFHLQRASLLAKNLDPKGLQSPRDGARRPFKRLSQQSFFMFITACERSGNLDAAVEAAERHNLLGLDVSKPSLKRLMLCCAEGPKRLDLVVRVYAVLQKMRYRVDSSVVDILMTAASACGNFDAAKEWMRSFVDAGVQVDIQPYLTVMRPALMAGRADVVLELAAMMEADEKLSDHPDISLTRAHAHLLVGDAAAAATAMRRAVALSAAPTEEEVQSERSAEVLELMFLSLPAALYGGGGGSKATTVKVGELRERMARCVSDLKIEGVIAEGAYDVDAAFAGVLDSGGGAEQEEGGEAAAAEKEEGAEGKEEEEEGVDGKEVAST